MKSALDAILRREQALYLDSLVPARDPLLARMEQVASAEGQPIADPEVAQLLRLLVRLRRPQRILEIGTNIGYSVVVMGRECGAEATIETIEIDRSILSTARQFVAEASLRCRTVFHEGAALDVIASLEGPFDFLFVDCVKTEYPAYLDAMLPKLAPGAVIVSDNLLWKGKVAQGVNDPATDALREYNHRIATDRRLTTAILPVGDGTGVSIVL